MQIEKSALCSFVTRWYAHSTPPPSLPLPPPSLLCVTQSAGQADTGTLTAPVTFSVILWHHVVVGSLNLHSTLCYASYVTHHHYNLVPSWISLPLDDINGTQTIKLHYKLYYTTIMSICTQHIFIIVKKKNLNITCAEI